MALSTHSKFFYGYKITTQNQYIDFQEGINVFRASLKVASYSSLSLAVEIKRALEAVGANTYTVLFDRSTRKFTISTTVNFSLLTGTGVNLGLSAFELLGYAVGTDKTGATSYVSDNTTGFEYSTQFFIQSYKPTSQNRKAIDGVINKSSSGVVEVVKFGNERFMSGELSFITDIPQTPGSLIRSNPSGLADFTQFIEWCTDKGPVEFMENENDVSTFQVFILESTEADSKGLDFDIVELYDRGLAEYFKSGVLKFRLLEV
jgi:hypothetical protein